MKLGSKAFMAGMLLLALAAWVFPGCGGDSVGIGPTPPGNMKGILYVANTTGNSLLSFRNATTVDGNTAPNTTVTNAAIMGPFHCFVDKTHNILFVANGAGNSVLIYDNASTVTGNTAPNRVLTGANTQLDIPGGIFVDTTNDVLYVSNINGNSITVYNGATIINGNVAPSREVTGLNNTPFGIAIDMTRDLLYCSLSNTNTIAVWIDASTVNGPTPPVRNIVGPATELSTPDGIFCDSNNNRIYIANQSNDTITVFSNAASADGNIPPLHAITGAATLLASPRDVFVDTNNGFLYVANYGSNSICEYHNAGTANGNLAPNRNITGANTTLNGPTGIFVDMNRNQ